MTTYAPSQVHRVSYNTENHVKDYRLLLLSDFLYGGRAIVYALLATTDMVRVGLRPSRRSYD